MALREPIFYPDPDIAEPPPQTEAALAGPGRGPGSRPPTTGMLPPGGLPEGRVSVLLAADTERDRTLVRVALLHARQSVDTDIDFIWCTLAEAPLRACVLYPTLIVIEDRSGWLPDGKALTLCRFLRKTLSWHTTVIVLASGPRLFGKKALRTAGADILLPATVQEPILASVLQASLAGGSAQP
ncbi:MAG TPA: hypothetical protein VIJ28_01225 [Chloroflexota bacterium]